MRHTLLFLLFISSYRYAQNLETKIPIDGTLIFTGKTAILPISNEVTGGISFLKVDETELQAYQIDKSGEMTAKLIIDIPKELGAFLDAIHINGTLRLFFTKKDAVGYMDIDFETGKANEVVMEDVYQKKERLIGYYGTKNKFYTVTIQENSSLGVYVFSDKDGYEKIVFDSDNEFFVEKYLSQKLFSKKSLINIIKTEEEASFTLNYNPKKLYVSENKITITIDYYKDEKGADHITDIIELDIPSQKIEAYTINFPKIIKTRSVKKEIQSRSYIKNELLFQLVHTKDQLIVQVVDYKSAKVLGFFDMNEFTNGYFSPPERETIPKYGFNKADEIKKNVRFLRNLYQNKSAIAVYEEGNHYGIKIGAFKIPSAGHRMENQLKNTPGMVVYSVDPFFAAVSVTVFLTAIIADGIAANPPNYGTTNSIYFNEKELDTFSASLVIDKESFEPVATAGIQSIYQKSRIHEKNLNDNRIRLVKPSLFKIRGDYYFSYFSIRDRSFIISNLL
ncbi:MAG: hypothetical protein JKY22_11425 [Flavobacteriaceae bacterium]|nr:hypothetical protein [Flavobacteriaceae bacterium]